MIKPQVDFSSLLAVFVKKKKKNNRNNNLKVIVKISLEKVNLNRKYKYLNILAIRF